MAGLFPCSWSQPLVYRRSQPRLLNAAYNLPIPRPPAHAPTVIPREEICSLVEDEELDQTVRQIQREAGADYEPSQVLNMTQEFNRNLDNAIDKLNTMPPKEQPIVEAPDLLNLMVCVSRYSHVLEGFIQKKNQPRK